MKVLDVRVDELSLNDAREKVSEFLLSQHQHTIFTPNPEMLVKAKKDEYFKQVLNAGEMNLCDGMGLWLAMRFKKSKNQEIKKSIERVTGVDFMLEICSVAERQGKSVFLLGSGSEEIVRKTGDELKRLFPNLKIAGVDKGPVIEESQKARKLESNVSELENETLINKINSSKPEILFVAFGMGKQEKWIYENLAKMPSIKVAMVVGGAFDYVSGNVPRAPLLLRKIGLEWMYRLIKQPKRFGRIFNATIKFVLLIISG